MFRAIVGLCALVWCVVLCVTVEPLQAQLRSDLKVDYLSTGEVIGIAGGTLGTFALGRFVRTSNAHTPPRWSKPPGVDLWFTDLLGGKPSPGPSNFMDTDLASVLNVVVTGTVIGALDAGYPRDHRGKDILQGQFVYYSGALTQKAVHDIFKGLVRRQRPLMRLAPEIAAQRDIPVQSRDNESFYSGHASSAFFAMTFLNKQTRDVMRRELTDSEYNSWSWVSPVVTYAWASFVALSRVHAYQHYFTDILAGAVAGWFIGELFFSWVDDYGYNEEGSSHGNRLLLRVTFTL